MKSTDDPDTVNGIEYASGTWWHVYDEWGETYGGADEAIGHWVGSIQANLDVENYQLASIEVGYLAHLIGDLAQPMHTDSSPKEDRIHSSYERAIDRRTELLDTNFSFSYDGLDAFDADSGPVLLARSSHTSYANLVRTYAAAGFNADIKRITQNSLNRGANALADVLAGFVATDDGSPPDLTPTPTPTPTSSPTPDEPYCDASYPDVCIPPPPPDLDCGEITHRNFRVFEPDPHGFDSDNDGYGCES